MARQGRKITKGADYMQLSASVIFTHNRFVNRLHTIQKPHITNDQIGQSGQPIWSHAWTFIPDKTLLISILYIKITNEEDLYQMYFILESVIFVTHSVVLISY